MPIKDKLTINVLNYNNNPVAVSTRDRSYTIEASEDGAPRKVPFSFSEIETINSKGNAFTSGTLRFEPDEEEETYEALRITNWRDLMTNEEVETVILSPSYEGLRKIIDVKNSSVFERIRGIYTRLKNDESNDISNRIERIITTRYQELIAGKTKTGISLTQKDSEKPVVIDQEAIREENAALKAQMEELKIMMSTLIEQKEPAKVESSAPSGAQDHVSKKPREGKKVADSGQE